MAYEIGYGKPPKAGQFKKGASGNPAGRPKKLLFDMGSILTNFMEELVEFNEFGKRRWRRGRN